MSDPATVRILLVEDHELLRDSLARSLATEPGFLIAGQCGTVTEALAIVAARPVDIVLLDLNLGSQQGGAFLNQCRTVGYKGKILVVTAGVGERESAWLMQRGCSGIFLKQDSPAELSRRIRAIIAEGPTETEPETPAPPPPIHTGRSTLPLTVREKEVLRAVCEGLANKEIAERLNVSESSVKSFLQQLFNKAGVRTRAQLVRVAIEEYWNELNAR